MLFVALTVLLAAAVFIAQFVASRRGKQLAAVQAELITEKDRQSLNDSKAKDVKIVEAQATSDKATEGLGKANLKIAELNTQSEGLRADAEKSREAIAQANLRAAEAKQHALEAELALAKFKQPRVINAEQRARILEKIKPFADTPYDLWVNPDSESTALMESIDSILNDAKWKFLPTEGTIVYAEKAGVVAQSGVSVHLPEERRKEFEPAVVALINALTAEGIPARGFADAETGEKGMKRDRIHIQIGSKPVD